MSVSKAPTRCGTRPSTSSSRLPEGPMLNLKIFVDETLYPECRDRLAAALGPIRTMLCDELKVEVPACQLALMPVLAMADLPPINAEMQILPRPERTRDHMLAVSRRLQ